MTTKALAKWTIGGVLVAVLAYAVTLIAFTWPIDEYSLDRSGLFGDSFGVVTCLFSGLAFAGMIITIHMQHNQLELQRKELGLQRKELAMTRDELAKAGEAQTAQVEQLKYSAELNALTTLAQCYTDISLERMPLRDGGATIPKRARNAVTSRNELIIMLAKRAGFEQQGEEADATIPIRKVATEPAR